ncbi:hypothetical protein IE077_000892 [Cardiosporidium cionae]|uniref:Uncharacterized protein n=1 Tax=Cardiosporidium cionae TaxID=476202 RepID=A0ABQ7J693_9APIC|nr:hypothetical protein IE077_000892 [Cardiosporidium cionae]|eukprot:KAF8819522.1 hypothetical protein IE077_000892 [Cardiosporidium cionae]
MGTLSAPLFHSCKGLIYGGSFGIISRRSVPFPLASFCNVIFTDELGGVRKESFGEVQNNCMQRRTYVAADLRNLWKRPRYQYTKYRISKPWSNDSYYDDLFIADPSRDDFTKFTKDVPLFLRFFKLVTDLEGRSKAFVEYAKRCTDGLVVEKDVYITKKELMQCIWKNGYSENEINAFEIAFPSDYKFHYPELAVLFDLSEEDCYKYCIRKRAETPEELVELTYKPPQNLLSSYGLCFVGVWLGLSNTVLSNAWFYSKTFPFGAVFYIREIRNYIWKEETTLLETAKENKEIGEEAVYNQMKKKCVSFGFDLDIYFSYRAALANRQRQLLSNRLTMKLVGIRQAEQSIQSSLQEAMVREMVSSFRHAFSTQPSMQNAAFQSSLSVLANEDMAEDPVEAHFKASLKKLKESNLSTVKADSQGDIVERIAAVFKQKEKAFLDMFTVKPEEAAEIKALVSKCSKNGEIFDFSLLSSDELARNRRKNPHST